MQRYLRLVLAITFVVCLEWLPVKLRPRLAEILAQRVRKRISVKKGGPEAWLEVHREAHRVGNEARTHRKGFPPTALPCSSRSSEALEVTPSAS